MSNFKTQTKPTNLMTSLLIIMALSFSFQAFGAKKKKVIKNPSLKTCHNVLKKRVKGSLIKRELFHISNMRQPCKGKLLSYLARKKDQKREQKVYSPTRLLSKFSNWGVNPKLESSINLAKAWKKFDKKKEIVVAVIDTGIDPTHPYLKNNIFVAEGIEGNRNYGIDFSFKGRKSTKTPSDDHGHGTHVSGIIKTVFPEVKILTLKYYNPKHTGQQNLESTIRALEYAVNAGVDIINYSGGGPEPAVKELKILKEAERKGILVVAAAGNDSSNIDNKFNAYYPASYGLANIITVTAHDQTIKTLNSSNWGKFSVDLSAPGYEINSSIPLKKSSKMTGTSQATAFVSGVAAMIKSQYPELNAQDIKMILRNSVRKYTSLKNKCITSGIIDAEKALATAKNYSSQTNTRTLAARKNKNKKRRANFK